MSNNNQLPRNVRYAFDYLTGKSITNDSGGRIKPLTRQQAVALIGNWMVETGSDDLSNLDVVEDGNGGAGRGLGQYTDARREAYDRARAAHIKGGGDANDIRYQLRYFTNEYLGRYDRDGKSLIGYTRALENAPTDDVAEATRYLTDNYFRPSEPHTERRISNAQRLWSQVNTPTKPVVASTPPRTIGATRPSVSQSPKPNPILNLFGINPPNKQPQQPRGNRSLLSIIFPFH